LDDPIEKVISWQLRSLDLEKIMEDALEVKRPWTLEERLIEAYDLKYHPDSLDEERQNQILEWMDLGLAQEDLGKVMGISQQRVSQWIGKIRGSM